MCRQLQIVHQWILSYRPVSRNLGSQLLVLLLCCALLPVASAGHDQNQVSQIQRNILFSSISLKEGLPQTTVTSIVQDRQGFIWFGTQEGLSRYNGYRIDSFFHDADNPSSLSHDWIWTLFEDRIGRLWIGTDGGGLNLYDHSSQSFLHYVHDPADPFSLSNDRVRVISQAGDGTLWIGTDGGGLNRLDPSNQRFIHYLHDPDNPKSLPNDKVLAILEDQNGIIWIGTYGGGLARLDPVTGLFRVYRHDPFRADSLSSDRIRTLYKDSQGRFWIGTDGGGLNLFDPVGGNFRRFQHDPLKSSSLSNNNVSSIHEDLDGALWVGTAGGLNEWVADSQVFLHYNNNPANPTSLSDDRVKSITQDRGGVLWVGTGRGISRWNYVSDAFVYYGKSNRRDSYLANSMVTSIDQGLDGQIWVGTFGGGVSRIDPLQKTATHYRHDPANPNSLSSDEVMSVYVARDRQVWLGTRKDGLNRLDLATGEIHHYRYDASDPHSLGSDSVTRIYGDPDGTLWVATYGGGLSRLPSGSERFEVFRHDPDDPKSLSSNRVLSLYRDSAGTMWIGTEDGGINELDETGRSFTRYQQNPNNLESLSSDTAWEILEGSDGSLWIGTNGGGLNRWLPEDRRDRRNRFMKYGKREGLYSNTIHAILHEDGKALWLSSNRGLTRFDPATGNVRHFDSQNALKSNDFINGARCQGQDGSMMFGSTEGLVVFHPKQIRFNHQSPPISVAAMSRMRPLASHSSIDQSIPLVSLDHMDYSVTFEFAALDFTSPDKNRYRYRLQGFDRDWIDPLQYRRATYTNLPADTYQFQVQASNNDGVWNEASAAIELRVNPPPWRSKWAYALYILIGLGVLSLYLYIQHRKSHWEAQQRQRLEDQVKERTLELSDRNSELEELNRKLKEASLTDSLTGLKNRRYLYEHIDNEIAWIDRRVAEAASDRDDVNGRVDEISLFFMMIDLDGFKKINDNYGHNAGDRALLQVRDILIHCCRSSDMVIRWGGDEFLILGRSSGRNATERLAERLRTELSAHSFTLGKGKTGQLSGSIGFALYPFVSLVPGLLHWESVVGIADQAAYLAKENQRNAWVGIYSRATISTAHNLLDFRDGLQSLAVQGLVEINSSISDELSLFKLQPRSAIQ